MNKKDYFFHEKGYLKFQQPLYKPFLKMLQQNKSFFIVHERGQRPKAGRTFCLD